MVMVTDDVFRKVDLGLATVFMAINLLGDKIFEIIVWRVRLALDRLFFQIVYLEVFIYIGLFANTQNNCKYRKSFLTFSPNNFKPYNVQIKTNDPDINQINRIH